MIIKKISSKKGFTLVELIIVIAIIAILAVTAFLLLTKRLAKARDASRSSNLANIENSLQISLTENSSLPKPDNYTLIYASGTTNVIGYQGYFGEGVKDSVGNINSAPKDGDDYFTYYLNADLNKYQLASFMENEIAYNPNVVSAVDYSSRYINVRGDKLGLLTDSNKSPLQTLGLTGLDLLTGTTSYIAYMDNSNSVAGTGKQLFTYYYNKTKSLLQNKDLAKADDSLVFYSDMETLTGTLLADLSQYANNGTCYNSGTLVSCDGSAGGPQSVQGKKGKGMQFDGLDDYILLGTGKNNTFDFNEFTIFVSLNVKREDVSYIDILSRGNNWRIDFGSKGKGGIGFTVYSGGNIYSNHPSCGRKLDEWFSYAGTMKANSFVKGYCNGEKYLTDAYNYPIINIASYVLIGKAQPNELFNGIIDEVRIYNRVLTDDEIKALNDATN